MTPTTDASQGGASASEPPSLRRLGLAHATDWSADHAITGTIPTGLVTLGWLLGDVDLTRTLIALSMVGVWALQLG